MSKTQFFRLLGDDDKDTALARAINGLRSDQESLPAYAVDPEDFREVPTSPFAYWVSERVRRLFVELPPFESEDREVRVGLQTSDDFRFVRTWWEVATKRILDAASGPHHDIPALQRWCRERTFEGKRWAPFAKGGEFSPYYADLPLVVNWEQDGEEMKAWAGSLYNQSHWSRIIKNVEYYFRPGLTFPRRTRRFCPKALPAGAAFGHGGQSAFVSSDLQAWLALLGSTVSQFAVTLFLGTSPQDQGGTNPQFETGIIKNIPTAPLASGVSFAMATAATAAVEARRNSDSATEVSHAFHVPALILAAGVSLADRMASWHARISNADRTLDRLQTEIDEITYQVYELTKDDQVAITASLSSSRDDGTRSTQTDEDDDENSEVMIQSPNPKTLTVDLASYPVGCTFGRWDVRIGSDPSLAPRLADPFGPLPVCSPSMLIGTDGLPARPGGIVSEEWMRARPDAISLPPEAAVRAPTIPDQEYPIRIAWDGVLVDDTDHPSDVVRRAHGVFEVLWGERAEEVEKEACEMLGVKELRDYFRNPRGFWDDHVKRYSKSRRKAPIYWLLQSRHRSYALWLYCHRLERDTLPRVLDQYVDPKLRLEQGRLDQLRTQRTQTGSTGSAARQAERAIERQEALLAEVQDFRDKLERVVKLDLTPELDDGVVLTIAPLWELVPWKVAKDYWQELLAGKYPWSSIGQQLRARGLVR